MDASIFLCPPSFPFAAQRPPFPPCEGKNDKEAPTACSFFQQIFSYLFLCLAHTKQTLQHVIQEILATTSQKRKSPLFYGRKWQFCEARKLAQCHPGSSKSERWLPNSGTRMSPHRPQRCKANSLCSGITPIPPSN